MKIRFEQPREAAILSIDLNLTFVSNFNLGLFIIGNTVGGKKQNVALGSFGVPRGLQRIKAPSIDRNNIFWGGENAAALHAAAGYSDTKCQSLVSID
jgi:hypothetical protein